MLLSLPLCFTVCAAVLCPQTVHPTALLQGRTLQSYKDYIRQLPAMDHPEAGQHPMLTLQPDQGEEVCPMNVHTTCCYGNLFTTQ